MALLLGFGLPFVTNSNFRTSYGEVPFVRVQTLALFFCAVLLQFAPRGLKSLYTIAGHRLTFHSSGQSTATRHFAA
jgi:hypothetical protein